jgi:hypothetical protein
LRNHSNYVKRPGGACPFKVRTRYDSSKDGWVILAASSEFRHNHGPDSRIVDNPLWRPVFANREAGAAVAEADRIAQLATSSTGRKADKGKRRAEELSEVRFLFFLFLPSLPPLLLD